MKGFTTNVGQTLQGTIFLIMSVVVTMDPGWDRTTLMALGLAVIGVFAIYTRGSGLTQEDGEDLKQTIDELRSLTDVLKEGRE